MDWVKVKSSNIDSVAYNSVTERFYVRFSRSGTYSYAAVPSKVYQDFLKSESKGKFLNSKIKGTYEFRKES